MSFLPPRYLLKYEHVSSDYREEFAKFLQREGFSIPDEDSYDQSHRKAGKFDDDSTTERPLSVSHKHKEATRNKLEAKPHTHTMVGGIYANIKAFFSHKHREAKLTCNKLEAKPHTCTTVGGMYVNIKDFLKKGVNRIKLYTNAKAELDTDVKPKQDKHTAKADRVKDVKTKTGTNVAKNKSHKKARRQEPTILAKDPLDQYDVPNSTKLSDTHPTDQYVSYYYSGKPLDIYRDFEESEGSSIEDHPSPDRYTQKAKSKGVDEVVECSEEDGGDTEMIKKQDDELVYILPKSEDDNQVYQLHKSDDDELIYGEWDTDSNREWDTDWDTDFDEGEDQYTM